LNVELLNSDTILILPPKVTSLSRVDAFSCKMLTGSLKELAPDKPIQYIR